MSGQREESLAEELLRRIKQQIDANTGQRKMIGADGEAAAYVNGEEAGYRSVARVIVKHHPELGAGLDIGKLSSIEKP
jgi:hypothetical protein